MWFVQVEVMPKEGILDPKGAAVEEALTSLGYRGVLHLRMGKLMQFLLDGATKQEVQEKVEKMCEQLLANPVIEDYRYHICKRDEGL